MKICPTCQQTYSDDVEFCPRDSTRLIAQATQTEAQLAAGLSRRFRLVRRLGAGGMGTVLLAEQIAVGNRPVALKVLNRKLLDDPDFLLRFQNEAGSTGRIHHPNVVTIYESAQADDGTPYIAMEFLEGESLREVLKRRGALPVTEVAEILQQAARGLNAAHKLGIIHRDLKPDNIFLTQGDENELVVKVVDFGIAKLRESATHTQTGMVLGTPAYMSCEQASGMRSDELDARSDVYSLGVVTYEMLTGRVPFHSDTPLGYLRKHMMEEPPPFRAIKPDLPALPQLESVVMKALTKDRDQRYGSVLEFAGEFARAAAAGPPPAAQPEPQREAVRPPPRATLAPVPRTIVPAAAEAEKASDQPTPAAAPSAGPRSTLRLQSIGEPHSKVPWLLGALGFIILIAVAWFWFSRAANGPGKEPKNPSKPVQIPVTESGAGQRGAASQSPTAASRLPPRPPAQPPDAKARLAEGHFLKGYALFSKNDFDGAIAEYREAIRLKPDLADAHGLLGLAQEQKGDLDGAIAEYREAIRLKPDFAETHYDLGLTLGKKGELDGAIAEYREAIRLKPDYAEAHNFLGVALGEKGDLDGEIAEHREAIRLRPGYAGAHWGLGMALSQKGDFDGAIAEYREVVRLRPNDAQAHFGLGVNLGLKGDWDGEITEEREAIRLNPDSAYVHNSLGVAL